MQPELAFSFFGFSYTVRSYDAFSVLAIFSIMLLAPLLLRRAGLRAGRNLVFTAVLLATFLAGARLFNCAVNPLQYGGSLQMWSWRFTGFSLYGGLIAAGIALPVLSSVFRVSLWAVADALVLSAGIAFSLARIGCFLNGCCGGVATNSLFGVTLPVAAAERELWGSLLGFVDPPAVVQVWPTQLFELGAALLGLVAILLFARRMRLEEGSIALLYALWFTAARWAVLPLRALPYSQFATDLFYPLLYGAIIVTCGALLYKRNKDNRRSDHESRITGVKL